MHLILVAGGPTNSTRFGGGCNKVFVEVKGLTLLGWALRSFVTACPVSRVAIAIDGKDFERAAAVAMAQGVTGENLVLVKSLDSRMASVGSAIERLAPAGRDLLAVHDSARPFPAAADIQRCLEAVDPEAPEFDAAVLCETATDSMARTAGGLLVEGIPRTGLVRITTPVVAEAEKILAAREKWASARQGEPLFPDGLEDSVLMARAGYSVHPVLASSANPKITFSSDVELALALASDNPHSGRTIRPGRG